MSNIIFRTPSIKNTTEHIYKKLYVIETSRFGHSFIPRSCSFCTNKISIVAVAVDKKLNLVTFPIKTKEKPKVKKFSFEESINAISICEDEKNNEQYLLLVVTKNEAFIIDSSSIITHINIFPTAVAILCLYENNVYIISGSDNGIILKDTISKSGNSNKIDPGCDSGLSIFQLSQTKELIACGFLNGSVCLLKTSNLDCIWKQTFSYGSIRAFAWDSLDKFLAFAGQDDNFYVINLNNNFSTTCFEGHNSFVNSISFDPYCKNDEQTIFTTAEDATIGFWVSNIKSNSNNTISVENSTFIGPFETTIRSIQAMKYFIVTVDSNGTIVCWRKTKSDK